MPTSGENMNRNPHSCIYMSSYDRGLEHLLKMWPEVRQAIPDATLVICYGWFLFAKYFADNPERMSWMEKMNKLMEQPGITHLGRISHEALREELLKTAVFSYPTHFGEISCISAMKAQAWGAIPVVINYAALKETVQWGIKVEGDIYDQETKDEYTKQLIALLRDEAKQDEIREPMMKWAKEKFSWANVAKEWDKEFRSVDLESELEDLLDHNQAIKAWEKAKGTEYEKKIWPLVEHAFDPKVYKDYYENHLVETPVSEEMALDCTKLAPRFAWVVDEIIKKKPTSVLDIGCADGYLCLTLATKGIHCDGVNLYLPSVKLANQRAMKWALPAVFSQQDFTKVNKKYDCVVMFELLEHLPDPKKAIEKAYSLLNMGGSLYLSTPLPDSWGVKTHITNKYNNPNRVKPWSVAAPAGHLRLWTEQEFRELLKGYKIEQFLIDLEHSMLVEIRKI